MQKLFASAELRLDEILAELKSGDLSAEMFSRRVELAQDLIFNLGRDAGRECRMADFAPSATARAGDSVGPVAGLFDLRAGGFAFLLVGEELRECSAHMRRRCFELGTGWPVFRSVSVAGNLDRNS
jgi:hypothetical protein